MDMLLVAKAVYIYPNPDDFDVQAVHMNDGYVVSDILSNVLENGGLLYV